MTEAQERFLRAIADRVPPASIVELHLFPAIRQGGYETGIAVIAAEPAAVATLGEPVATQGELDIACEVRPGTGGEEDVEALLEADGVGDETDATPDAESAFATSEPPQRHIVLSARYRLTLKGIDRGKWDVEVLAQADAPLVTVDAVVRGVQRRAGDSGEPERLTGDALRALLDEWSCTATTR